MYETAVRTSTLNIWVKVIEPHKRNFLWSATFFKISKKLIWIVNVFNIKKEM